MRRARGGGLLQGNFCTQQGICVGTRDAEQYGSMLKTGAIQAAPDPSTERVRWA